jgi:hypothetical protein
MSLYAILVKFSPVEGVTGADVTGASAKVVSTGRITSGPPLSSSLVSTTCGPNALTNSLL